MIGGGRSRAAVLVLALAAAGTDPLHAQGLRVAAGAKAGFYVPLTDLVVFEEPGLDRGFGLAGSLGVGGVVEVGRAGGRLALRAGGLWIPTELEAPGPSPGPGEGVRVTFFGLDAVYRPLSSPRLERSRALGLAAGLGVKGYDFESAASEDARDLAVHLGARYDVDMGEWVLVVEVESWLSRYAPGGTRARFQHDLFLGVGFTTRLF